MGYVAVRGGQEAIEESLKLLEWERVRPERCVDIESIQAAFPDLIDQIMGESSLYAPELAALALKQAQGSPEEAVFLLRAFRSTLERPYVSRVVESESMKVDRRISAAFKDVPGGQVLGATRDYTHRLLDFDLREEDGDSLHEARKRLKREWRRQAIAEALAKSDGSAASSGGGASVGTAGAPGGASAATMPSGVGKSGGASAVASGATAAADALGRLPKVADYLREQGLLVEHERNDEEPIDVTMEPLVFPAPRSARLQTLARGMTQAVSALGYAAIRGFGPAHPTVAELRHGTIEVVIDHPLGSSGEGDAYCVGEIPVTEVESLFEVETADAEGEKVLSFDLGYGMVMGRAETKAIAMSVLDNCLEQGDKRFPTQDEEFVLYHVDGIEATGFISHLKLPHYVTFQSKLSAVRKTRDAEEDGGSDAECASLCIENEPSGADASADSSINALDGAPVANADDLTDFDTE